MFLYFDTKIKIKFIIGILIATFFVFPFIYGLSYAANETETSNDSASTTQESTIEQQKAAEAAAAAKKAEEEKKAAEDKIIAEKINQNQKKLLDLNQQIKGFQQQITSVQSKSNSLKSEIAIYNTQIQSSQLEIDVKETQIENKNLQIKQLEQIIEQKNKELVDNRRVLSKLIVELNEYDNQYALKSTIGSDSLSAFLDQIQYTKNLQARIFQLVQKIKVLKAQLEDQQKKLEIEVVQLTELRNELQANQNSLLEIQAQKQQLLKQTQGLERNYQKLLATSKQDADNLQKEINDLDSQIRTKLGKKSIGAAKGILAWPMDGILTQKYGNTGFTALGYNFHNGIDIAAPAGRAIYAAADGTVLATDQSQAAFGNWVALKSTIKTSKGEASIVTVYAHLQRIKVTVGQKLEQGDLIGYEGNTGNTTARLYGPERGYHLHFGVYDAEGFGISNGKYTNIYGNYKVPFGYTYNPLDFLSAD
jgi:murein DD-endopeptidase MepM/ murein hydrolase activator NlpD